MFMTTSLMGMCDLEIRIVNDQQQTSAAAGEQSNPFCPLCIALAFLLLESSFDQIRKFSSPMADCMLRV